MTDNHPVGMDGTPAIMPINDGEWGEIRWQHGPIQVHGRNGVLLEEILEDYIIPRLQGFNRDRIEAPAGTPLTEAPDGYIANPFRCHENSLAITHLKSALLWLNRRTELRQQQGVEGTYGSHESGA